MLVVFSFFCYFSATAKKCKVLTLNIRYDCEYDGINCWSNRFPLLCDFLKRENADIVCFQEVLDNQYFNLTSGLVDYGSVGVGRIDGKRKGEYAPIFYKKLKYSKISEGTFWLSETPDIQGSIGWDAGQPRIVTWVKLKDRKGKAFLVMNTHLDDKGSKARQKSSEQILEIVDTWGNTPIVLMGDFNDLADSPTYLIITENNSFVDVDKIAKKKVGVRYTFHSFGKIEEKARRKIDYIFVKNMRKTTYEMIPKEQVIDGAFLSDHNPIIAEIVY